MLPPYALPHESEPPPRPENRFTPEYQDRPGGPWYPWYRYHVETNFLDGRLTRVASMLSHRVECVASPLRPLARRGACRVEDRVEY